MPVSAGLLILANLGIFAAAADNLRRGVPREAGWATAGVIGLAVPGVIGTPFLIAGAAVLAPGGSKLLARWAPRSATRQLGRFLDDLERRFPRRLVLRLRQTMP
jgi:hypothetical protein